MATAEPGTIRSKSRANAAMVLPEKRDVPDVIKTGSPIRALAFTSTAQADGIHLVSGDKEAVRVWRLRSNWQWQQMGWAEAKDVRCIAVSADGRWIAAGKSWGETTVWDTGKKVTTGSDMPPRLDKPVFTDNDGHTVTSVDFSPIDSTRLVIASGSRTASIWDIANKKRLVGPLQHSYWVVAAKFSPDGKYIATATYHRDSVRLYNSYDGSLFAECEANVPAYYNTGLLWSKDSIFVLSKNTTKTENATNTTNTIKEFRIPSKAKKSILRADSEGQVSESNYPCIASSHPGHFIIYSACGGVKILRASVRDPRNIQEETLPFEPSQDVLSMAISPDGQLLATGGWDGNGVGSITFTRRPVDYGNLEFTRPADKIKAVNVPDIPQKIFTGLESYEDAARGFGLCGFEWTVAAATGDASSGIFLSHRPKDAQVSQVYRISTDPANTELERLTHFNIGTGRIISTFRPIAGEDWRGVYRPGGAIMSMDFNGNEHFQLWRYWEDQPYGKVVPKIDGELDNAPGKGRIERLTHDNYRYNNVVISPSNKLMAFDSNKENSTDTLAYLTRLTGSNTGATANSIPFNLPSKLITPPLRDGVTERWVTRSFSVDDKYLLLSRVYGNAHQTMFFVDISGPEPAKVKRILLPGATERETLTKFSGSFSLDPANPHVVYVVTDAYGDFDAVVAYNIDKGTVTHITTPGLGASVPVLKPIAREVGSLAVTNVCIYFIANVEGWCVLYAMPLSGPNKNKVVEVKLKWEGGWIDYAHNGRNGRPHELVLCLSSHRSRGFVRKALLDLQTPLKYTRDGNAYVDVEPTPYVQAAAPEIPKAVAPRLIQFKSFDGLQVPALYYHPNEGKSKAPVVIGIHDGPESQATIQYRTATHGYLLNELGIAVIYPNVRGSSGYGRKYVSADDVEKREDSVKDINALIEYIGSGLSAELDSARIAVMGGSYGGYMVFATLTHYSSKLRCGVANFGIANWVTFLENTAPVRRANRRLEYGDESDPVIRSFLERISPINNAEKISVPLFITHGETDTRVTVHEAVAMYEIVKGKAGGKTQLVICEGEGHGYRQKSVIEYVNAATIDYLKKFLLS